MRNFDYISLAERSWPSDILNLAAKIHECRGRQEMYVRWKPAGLDRLVKIAKIQSAEASNKIEGIVTTGTRMKQLFAERTMPRNRDENEIMGYRDVLNTIHESSEFIPVRPSYILQLHRDLLRRSGSSYGGRFKNVQNYISETRSDGTSFIRFTPAAPYETPMAVEALCEAYEQAAAKESIDALLLIPCFILDFLCIHPFNDGSGRMSRLLTLLLLYKHGYEVGRYISIEKQIEKTKDRYYDVLEASGIGWQEESNDPLPFIRYMLTVVMACYTEFEERAVMLDNAGTSAYGIVKKYAAEKLGRFTGADVLSHCPGIGRSSVLAALKRLTEEGMLLRLGAGKGTFYVKADCLETKPTDRDAAAKPAAEE